MRTLAILLLSCLTVSAQVGLRSAGFVAAAAKPAEASGYLLSQDFETGTLPDGWTVTDGSPVWNYTPALLGSYSLEGHNATIGTYGTFTDSSEVWVYLQCCFPVAIPAAIKSCYTLRDSSDNIVCLLRVSVDGKFIIQHGASTDTGDFVITSGFTNHVWIHWIKGTGADGKATNYVSVNGVFPGFTSPDAKVSVGGATTDAARFKFASTALWTNICDHVRISASPIGSNPP